MESAERRSVLWKNLKQRMGFCGSRWSIGASDMSTRDEVEEDIQGTHQPEEPSAADDGVTVAEEAEDDLIDCMGQIPATNGGNGMMNLATALAAERNLRDVVGPVTPTVRTTSPSTPLKSLMRLFEETDGGDLKRKRERRESGGGGGGGLDSLCCVCMEREKGAAFIPCGHTYCRVCSRELWLNSGSCPQCNHSIMEILDIF